MDRAAVQIRIALADQTSQIDRATVTLHGIGREFDAAAEGASVGVRVPTAGVHSGNSGIKGVPIYGALFRRFHPDLSIFDGNIGYNAVHVESRKNSGIAVFTVKSVLTADVDHRAENGQILNRGFGDCAEHGGRSVAGHAVVVPYGSCVLGTVATRVNRSTQHLQAADAVSVAEQRSAEGKVPPARIKVLVVLEIASDGRPGLCQLDIRGQFIGTVQVIGDRAQLFLRGDRRELHPARIKGAVAVGIKAFQFGQGHDLAVQLALFDLLGSADFHLTLADEAELLPHEPQIGRHAVDQIRLRYIGARLPAGKVVSVTDGIRQGHIQIGVITGGNLKDRFLFCCDRLPVFIIAAFFIAVQFVVSGVIGRVQIKTNGVGLRPGARRGRGAECGQAEQHSQAKHGGTKNADGLVFHDNSPIFCYFVLQLLKALYCLSFPSIHASLRIQKLPIRRISSDELPICTSTAPFSIFQRMSRSRKARKLGETLKVMHFFSPGCSATRQKPANSFTGRVISAYSSCK